MTVLNIHHGEPPAGAVEIMRPTKWGNPFRAEKHGRGKAVQLYRRWLWKQIRTGKISLDELAALHGKDLVCCCVPKDCHGHVLEAAASWACSLIRNKGAGLPF